MLFQWNMIGHRKQLERLEMDIDSGNVSHAYLFSGPNDIGKHRIAQVFANILLCPNGYCRQCQDCSLFQSGAHPDLIRIDDNQESIKIDQIRELIQKTNLTSQGKRRVVLMENIERMPIEAQNSFLKTLEEPAGNSVFLLTCSQVTHVLPTLLSRVRTLEFFPLADSILKAALKEKFGDHTDLEEAIQIAQGRPGLAISLLESPTLLSEYKGIYNQIDHFLRENDIVSKFAFVEQIEEDEKSIDLFFDSFSRYLRKLLYEFLIEEGHPLKTRYSLEDIIQLFEYLIKTRYLIDRNANKKLALENFFLQTEK